MGWMKVCREKLSSGDLRHLVFKQMSKIWDVGKITEVKNIVKTTEVKNLVKTTEVKNVIKTTEVKNLYVDMLNLFDPQVLWKRLYSLRGKYHSTLQIKNIKLHIVTDIKVTINSLSVFGMRYLVGYLFYYFYFFLRPYGPAPRPKA